MTAAKYTNFKACCESGGTEKHRRYQAEAPFSDRPYQRCPASAAEARRQKPGFSQKGFGRGVPKPWMLPVSFGLNQMRNSAELFASLSSLSLALGQLHKQVDDTAMQVGSQAYAAARTVYDCARSSFAGPALQKAAGELGKRFGRRSASQTSAPAENTPAPTPPAPATASA